MRDRPRDDEPPDQPPERDRPPEGDRPDRRPDAPGRPEMPGKDYQPDRRVLTPIQRQYVRDHADNPPESPPDRYTIDWETGETLDLRPRHPAADEPEAAADDAPEGEFGDISGVHDPLDATRPKDQKGGLAYVHPADQWSLEYTLTKDADGNFEKFPDPEGEWTDYVNDGGPDIDHFRANNCLDCSVAAIATWYGHPTVAAPRFPDITPDERLDRYTGEWDGPDRAAQWLEARYEGLGSGAQGFAAIEQKLRDAGHGSAAVLITAWSMHPGSHAWNAFNHNGKIVWYDPQVSITADQPVYSASRVRSVAAVCLDREGKQL